MEPIAHIRTDFPEKFGIPRQSGLVDGLEGRIVFEPKFRHPDAVRDWSSSAISGFCGSFRKMKRRAGPSR